MAKARFRVSGIKTTSDLRGIGKHNVDRISETNFDIDRERSNVNITLKNCGGNYGLMFEKITRDLKIQHDEQMKTTRKSRQKSFLDKVNEDKADVACEFLMSASPEYFKGKSHDEVREWAQTSLDFITKKIGIEEKNILHAVVHMDEKTPHLHVVAVPLVEKYDGRRKKDVLTISRKHFIKKRDEMAKVQTDYVDHLKENGSELERRMEKTGAKHLDVARFKIQKTEERLKTIERKLSEKSFEMTKLKNEKESLENEKNLLEKNVGSRKNELMEMSKNIPPELKIKAKKEKKTIIEDKMITFGKPKTVEKETGNLVITRDEYKKMRGVVNAANEIKSDYDRLQQTDLVQENKKIRHDMYWLQKKNKGLEQSNSTLKHQLNESHNEIYRLKGRISDLKHEIKLVYQTTKEFLEERTNDFKGHLRDFVDKVKEKVPGSEFEHSHKRERRREMDRGMER